MFFKVTYKMEYFMVELFATILAVFMLTSYVISYHILSFQIHELKFNYTRTLISLSLFKSLYNTILWKKPDLYTSINQSINQSMLFTFSDRQTLGYELKGLTVQSDEAVYVGALAATLLSIMGVAIILLDIQKLMQDFKMMRSNIRSMYSQHKRRTQVSDSSSSLNRAASPPAEGF